MHFLLNLNFLGSKRPNSEVLGDRAPQYSGRSWRGAKPPLTAGDRGRLRWSWVRLRGPLQGHGATCGGCRMQNVCTDSCVIGSLVKKWGQKTRPSHEKLRVSDRNDAHTTKKHFENAGFLGAIKISFSSGATILVDCVLP